jgi:beta-aspartyl-peptidase (threonine type)
VIVVASSNGKVGIRQAMDVLRSGGTALDAVEAGIRQVEANPEDHSVGYSGYPNLLGQVELDAAIMDGATLAAGAVGAMRGYMYAISVARQVMERLPHVFLVGEGAERFAAEMGFERQDLLTKEAYSVWRERLCEDLPEQEVAGLPERKDLWRLVELATDPERARGTVNFVAQDGEGNIAAGVSTSGWAWKYPGRLGDSPVIGAGLYADNRAGAAACTGMGEMAIRACTAHSVVSYLRAGLSLQEAGRQGMEDLNHLEGRYLSVMSLIALDHEGRPAGFSSVAERTFIYMKPQMDDPVEEPRIHVPVKRRWGVA